MADIGIFTKNADIQALVGVNAGTTEKAEAATDIYVLNVEAAINVQTRTDWSALWTAGDLNTTHRLLLTQAGAAKCAMVVINANSNGYGSREYETLLDFLNSLYDESIKLLKEPDADAFLQDQS